MGMGKPQPARSGPAGGNRFRRRLSVEVLGAAQLVDPLHDVELPLG
jgi:hypothetical protein